MNTVEYFIHLLSCHLNGTQPVAEKRQDWQKIYLLAGEHNVAAIVTHEIKKLPQEYRPTGGLWSKFNQSLGLTVRNYENKMQSLALFISTLTDKKIPHLLVKGAVLRNLYPVAELRTSSDTDAIVRPSDYLDAIDALKAKGFVVKTLNNNVAELQLGNNIFEVHTELEHINIQSKIYFSTPFFDISESSGYTYKLKPVYHLLYVITHIAHHLKAGGAGVRMIMDVDILIRAYQDINIDDFFELCDNINIKKTAEALIALSKKWFNTPVAINYTFEDEDERPLFNSLTDIVIHGGVFGQLNGGSGTVLLQKNIGESGKADFKTKLKTLFSWLFPKPDYLKSQFLYAEQHKILIPLAWLHRIVRGFTKHFAHSKKSFKEMFTAEEMSEKQNELLKELEINDR